MSVVNFEGLELSFNINKIAIDLGIVKVYWYGILIVIGIILALIFLKKDDGKHGIKFKNILELAVFLLPISIICARIYYVIFKFDSYKNNILSILYISDGGLAIYGGIIGGVITAYIYCKNKRINFLDVCDYIIPYVPLAQAIGRFGNFFNQEAHGTETMSILRMGIIENGKYIQVHPTFLYEAFFDVIIFVILYLIRNKRKFNGMLIYLYLFMYGFIRFFIEGIRTDSLMIGNFRVSQLLSISLAVIFGTFVVIKLLKNKNKCDKSSLK